MPLRGGGPLARYGAVASADGRLLLAPAGPTLRVYAAAGGADAPLLVLRGHAADVTAVARHPADEGKVRDGGGRRRRAARADGGRIAPCRAAHRHMRPGGAHACVGGCACARMVCV